MALLQCYLGAKAICKGIRSTAACLNGDCLQFNGRMRIVEATSLDSLDYENSLEWRSRCGLTSSPRKRSGDTGHRENTKERTSRKPEGKSAGPDELRPLTGKNYKVVPFKLGEGKRGSLLILLVC